MQAWVQRQDFSARYDSLRNDQFVDALFASMGVVPPASERDSLVAALSNGTSRADVLASIVEDGQFTQQQLDPAFVTMQYFGYLRRDPDSDGFNYWLGKLEAEGGDYRRAEMVKAFLSSSEYRKRFEQW